MKRRTDSRFYICRETHIADNPIPYMCISGLEPDARSVRIFYARYAARNISSPAAGDLWTDIAH